MSWIWWGLVPLVLLVSFGLTARLRRYALDHRLLDVPGQRSSHEQPTPRGGGLSIVAGFYLGLAILWWWGGLPPSLAIALLGSGGLVALLGFIDDHGHVPAAWRLLGHFAAAAWGLWWLGLPPVTIGGLSSGFLFYPLAALCLVWLLNLYNFMDGIDAIASVEALSLCLGGLLLYLLVDAPSVHGVLLAVLAASVAGFLAWNLPPARIFMGDVGSGFLGVVIGLLALQAAWVSPEVFWGWCILLGVFITDASLTLLRRLLRGDKVYQAHRSHAYQRAARALGGHGPVVWRVALMNLCWLLPLALVVGLGWLHPLAGICLAYAPLVAVALACGAGKPD